VPVADTGPESFEFFASRDMLEVLRIGKIKRDEFFRLGDRVSAAKVAAIMVDIESKLSEIATKTAAMADEAALARLASTRRRPQTDRSRHLEDSIKSEPWLLGSVKIALIDELNQAINPEDGRPYWRTQEYGSAPDAAVGWEGNEMAGRILYGRFDDDRPRADFRRSNLGAALAPSAGFTWGHPGSNAGYGTIEEELPPRHFLREGSEVAWGFYRAEVARLSVEMAGRVVRLMTSP
jgi:hypothetical protein